MYSIAWLTKHNFFKNLFILYIFVPPKLMNKDKLLFISVQILVYFVQFLFTQNNYQRASIYFILLYICLQKEFHCVVQFRSPKNNYLSNYPNFCLFSTVLVSKINH